MLLLLPSLVFAGPAAAQNSSGALEPLLEQWGFPAGALTIFGGTEADAYRMLGRPASDGTYPDELDGGPDFRQLGYVLPGGSTLELTLCTEPKRRWFGMTRSSAFCAMELVYPHEPDAQMRARALEVLDALAPIAQDTFGACDTTYYVFDGFTISLSSRVKPFRISVLLERYRPTAEEETAEPGS